MATFRVAGASTEYLAITGWGVDDVKLAKKAWVWLGQRCTTLDAAPASYQLVAQGATSENFPVVLRAVCIVGPNTDSTAVAGEKRNPVLFIRGKLLRAPRRSNKKLVDGIVEGRVRALAAGMTTDEIFAKGAAGFAKEALDSAQLGLSKYGLCVYGATVERLAVDVPANKVSIVAAAEAGAPAAMGLSVQVEPGAVSLSPKIQVNLSVATKKAVAGAGRVEAHWETEEVKNLLHRLAAKVNQEQLSKANDTRTQVEEESDAALRHAKMMKIAAAAAALTMEQATKVKAMAECMKAAAAILEDAVSARQQQAAGVQSKMLPPACVARGDDLTTWRKMIMMESQYFM